MTDPATLTDSAEQPYDDPFRKTCLVPYVDPSRAPVPVQEGLKMLPFRRNIFYLLANAHGQFPHVAGLIGSLLDSNTRKIRLLDWQLVALRTTTILGAKYEYNINLPIAEAFEMPEEKIEAMGCPADDVLNVSIGPWSERDRVILRVVDEQLATYSNKPETIKDALTLLTHEELIEILVVIGTYALACRVVNGLKIDDDPPVPGLKDKLRKAIR
ncbi:MAG: hypothetical protein M1821_009662 [Bathelium mastoideum]|nr:MAG: hypothetical protein M1821_009662 [Bathelium mastoideum]KAI9690579.1 MAG: hypothetical protein M1822_009542 [Bathelium mastoideum]